MNEKERVTCADCKLCERVDAKGKVHCSWLRIASDTLTPCEKFREKGNAR